MFQISGHEAFLTTVGKLNFFRWALEKGIIDYIKANFTKIEKEMNACQREIQKSRRESDKTASTNTTKSSTRRRARMADMAGGQAITSKVMQKHELEVQVSFD
jgi:hypothetical protein